jgi:hypothetical protein
MSHATTIASDLPFESGTLNDAPPLTLRRLFFAHKGPMLLTYGLFNVENLLRLAQPFVLGLAINGLLDGSYFGLLLFVVQHVLHMGISTARRLYDTRAFNAIYTDLATTLVTGQRGRRVDVSRVAARSALSRGYVEFFEEHVPLLIRSGYSVVGALLLLGWYDFMLVPYCVALVLPAALLNAAYGRKTLILSKRLHDQFEREVDVIGRGDAGEVRGHYDGVAASRVKLSDAEAVNFSLMEFFVLALIVAALVQFCRPGEVAAGDVFAVFRYLMMFVMGLDAVPRLVQQVSRLKDIAYRMHGVGIR